MNLGNDKIKDILAGGNYITDADLKRAEDVSKKENISIVEYLLSEKIITKDILGQAIAEFYKVPYADLNTYQPTRDQVLRISEEIAKKFRIVLFKDDKKIITITTDDPTQKDLDAELAKIFPNQKIKIEFSLSEDIDATFVNYQKALETRFAEIIKKQKKVAPEIIEQIFEDAMVFNSSDIHFDPQEKEVVIRFRVDGVLQEAGRVQKEYYENILNKIKVLSHTRLDEHFSAQDGAIRYKTKNGIVDMRVSIAPVLDGEKIVIRILSEYVRGFSLTDLGLSAKDQEIMTKASKKPFGMILVTGPTGSGKTTTLYALVKLLNETSVNITTIEDPVEYKILGVNQIQVNSETNLTFAKGLRSIARQDPDIILVGEIRDQETAEIAVNAALTGHLLLSTLHANDAATGIPRLLEMGIEPFLLASTLEVIFAQRLVRKICENCRHSQTYSAEEIKKLIPDGKEYFGGKSITLYKGKGCQACGHTGYKGRSAIFEIISVNQEMKELILKNPSAKSIWDLAERNGTTALFDDGIEKVKRGLTTLEELIRVASPPEKAKENNPIVHVDDNYPPPVKIKKTKKIQE